jgi:hypothetical protein
LLAGFTVTVGVVFVVPTPLGLAVPPHPTAANPNAETSTKTLNIFRTLRQRPGTKNSSSPRVTVPPAVLNHPEFPNRKLAVLGAVVLTVAVVVPVVVAEVITTLEGPIEQDGGLTAPAGDDVSAHVRLTAPE